MARRLWLIAESDLNDPRVVTPLSAGGLGMDAQWSDDFHHALFAVLSPKSEKGYYADFGELGQLAKALEQSFVYDGIYSQYRERVHGRPAGHLSQHRFLGYIQNHDQVGNRALGDRLREVSGFDHAKIAAAFVLMGPFIPLLFQGEEWAASSPFLYFADHEDEEMARLVSEGRKREFAAFGWAPESIPDPEDVETFEQSKLKWDEMLKGEHTEMLDWYRQLIRLRRDIPSLNVGEPGQTQVTFCERDRWLSMERGDVRVSCNLGDTARLFAVPEGGRVVLSSRGTLCPLNDNLLLLPDTVVILGL
jgi:maltooligosyltrehalose trehalohydrolase